MQSIQLPRSVKGVAFHVVFFAQVCVDDFIVNTDLSKKTTLDRARKPNRMHSSDQGRFVVSVWNLSSFLHRWLVAHVVSIAHYSCTALRQLFDKLCMHYGRFVRNGAIDQAVRAFFKLPVEYAASREFLRCHNVAEPREVLKAVFYI